MTILPNGNVGIGTTNPSKKLHIQGNGGGSAGIQFSSTNSSGAGYMYIQRNTDGKAFVLNQSNHAMILGANNRYDSLRGGPQLYLKETGNIGIGTDSPTYKLEIYTEEANTYHNDGNVAHDNGFYLHGPANYYGRCFVLENRMQEASHSSRPALFRNLGSSGHWFAGKAENGCGIVVIDSVGPSSDNSNTGSGTYYTDGVSLLIGNNLDYSNRKTNFVVKQNGNIGMGLNEPQDKIHTDGNIRLGGDGIIRAASNSYSHFGSITLQAGGNGKSASDIHTFQPAAGGSLKLQGNWNDGHLIYTHNNVQRFGVYSNGCVGINTSNPLQKLHIDSGNALIRGYDAAQYLYFQYHDANAYFGGHSNAVLAGIEFQGNEQMEGDSGTNTFRSFSAIRAHKGVSNGTFGGSLKFYTHADSESSYNLQQRMSISHNGTVYIGTTSESRQHESCRLIVYERAEMVAGGQTAGIWFNQTQGATDWFFGKTNHESNGDIGFYHGGWEAYVTHDGKWYRQSAHAYSDRRIKKNITSVPDNLSLKKLRNIDVVYYDYILNTEKYKTIGFIAQQVKEHAPEVVTIQNRQIPNEMREITPEWISEDEIQVNIN